MTMTSPNLDDISSALLTGLRAAESLMTWHTPNSNGYELAEHYRDTCERGIKAFDQIRAQLREGKAHIELSADREAPRTCECNATSHPPCSFCESGAGDPRED